jgi:hypothetical protein
MTSGEKTARTFGKKTTRSRKVCWRTARAGKARPSSLKIRAVGLSLQPPGRRAAAAPGRRGAAAGAVDGEVLREEGLGLREEGLGAAAPGRRARGGGLLARVR